MIFNRESYSMEIYYTYYGESMFLINLLSIFLMAGVLQKKCMISIQIIQLTSYKYISYVQLVKNTFIQFFTHWNK